MKKKEVKGPFSLGLMFLLLFMVRTGTAMPSEERFPKVSFKLSGGPGILAVGDINTALKSLNNNKVFRSVRKENPENDPEYSHVEGNIRPLRNSYANWEAELRLDMSPRLAFGISTFSPIHRRNESSLTYTYVGSVGPQVHTWTFRPEFRVSYPLMVNFYYSLPFKKNLRYSIGAGAGFYSARAAQELEFLLVVPSGDSELVIYQWDTKRKFSFAFHGHIALSLDYSISSRLSVIAELQARYAKIGNLEGTWKSSTTAGYSEEKEGTLYFFNMWDYHIGTRIDSLEIWPEPPEGDFRWIEDLRKAVLDLSGMSLRVGIRFRVF